MDLTQITPVKKRTLANYKELLRKLLPVGILWENLSDDWDLLLEAFAVELDRYEQRVIDLRREIVPGLSSELLSDWEEIALLPDEMPSPTATETERQEIVHTKIFAILEPGPTEQFFIDYAAELNITITSFTTIDRFRVGAARVGDRLNDEYTEAFVWVVNYTGGTTEERQAMKVAFERMAPAHTEVRFIPVI